MGCRRTVVWAVAGALGVASGSAAASGFALYEHGSGLGNAFAGGAASAEDASTIYFNPAGLARLSGKQIVVGAHAIRPSMKFGNTASVPALLQPTVGGDGGDGGSWALVPSGYFAMEISPQLRAGVGIMAPFGLKTDYNPTWMGRFQAIKSDIKTINLNPAVSYSLNDTVSIGVGLNYQHIKGELTSAVNYSAAAGGALGAGLEGYSSVSGSDSAWGGNVGVLVNAGPKTRVGLAYRSRVKYRLTGTVVFTGVPAPLAAVPALQNGPVTLPISMPDSASISVFHQLNDKWDVMGDLGWMGWSVLQQLKIDRTSGLNVMTVQENWRDTWRIAAGSNYHYNNQWTARVGVAYDQTPVSDAFRTARVPDSARYQLAVGGQYKPGKNSALDFGYSHLFMNNANIADRQAAAGRGDLVGSFKNSVDILSVVYAYSF
ncbi:MAG TPA: outer membrane protein transport protein [Gallionella sp.]|nr:outer membrane protein transport protein [Gallionella sp.]